MKRWMFVLLMCLLLCGCDTVPQADETILPNETEMTDPTEPSGSYDPDSIVEEQTKGAVRAYPLDIADCYGLVSMDGDLVVFSGEQTTTLTRLSGENLYTTARTELVTPIYPEDVSTQVTEKGLSYYSEETREIVLLDTTLREVNRIDVPEDLTGIPMLSANRKVLYYCTPDAIRALDLESGISRILKEITYPVQSVSGLLMGDTVLRCSLSDGEGEWKAFFLSTDTGEILWETEDNLMLTTTQDAYYVIRPEGAMQAMIYGKIGHEDKMLIPADVTADTWCFETLNGAVTAAMQDDQNTVILNYYDLESGLCLSTLTLEGCSYISGIVAGDDGLIYILSYNGEDGMNTIYRWDVNDLPSDDETVYTGPRYTVDSPDEEGLARCRAYAEQIGEQFGVQVLIGVDAVEYQPWDYTFEIEYQVPLIWRDLEILEELLANYPEGMLEAAAETTDSGELKICLVRQLYGSPESGSLDTAEGAQYWIDGEAYLALAVGYDMTKNLYHELFHVMDTKVLSDSTAYYDWEDLNPEGFAYDYDYVANQYRADHQYLEDETRAFIDSYSMSFPKEDRARIMEYAMTPGNESYFQSEAMQAKLYQLCLGIRDAFDLEKSAETFLWEQYLNVSLAFEDAA